MASKNIEVVLVHSVDPAAPRPGGGVKYFHQMLHFLTERSVNTTLVGVQLGEREMEQGKFTFLPVLKKSDTWYKYILALLFKAPRLRIPPMAVIHAMRLDFMLAFVLFHRRNPKVFTPGSPALHHARLHWPGLYPFVAPLYHIVESFCLRNIDCIATTDAIAEYYLRRYPWVSEKVKVLPVSGVDLSSFRPLNRKALRQQWGFGEEERIVVYAGRLARVKNLDLLLRAFPLVRQQVTSARLVIAADGDELSRLEKLATELGLPGVFYTGVSSVRIPELMNCADVVTLCSIKDGCEASPNVVREALACGVPVVSTDVGDVGQIVNSPTLGRIVGWDEKSLAQGIVEVLTTLDPASDEVRRTCRAAVHALGFDALGEEVTKLYQQALARRGFGPLFPD